MAATQDAYSVGEHDWQSPDYVSWWIERDQARDTERRARLRRMLAQAGWLKEAAPAVIDIGGGYGVLTEEVCRMWPRARITLQDYSEPMLDEARQRLAAAAERVAFVRADLRDPAWTTTVAGPFDLAVSAIAIHNLRDQAVIAEVYRGIARILKPGRLFLDYDLFFDKIGGVAGHQRMLRDGGFARADCLFEYPPAAALAGFMSGAKP